MKVILLKDVAKIGRRSQIVEVPNGYARNQLIPKGMAQPATPANEKRIKLLQANAEASNEANSTRFEAAVAALKDVKPQVPAEVNEKGHTFKAISLDEIVAAIIAAGATVDTSMISVDKPVKSTGDHVISLVSGSQKSDVTIEVVKK